MSKGREDALRIRLSADLKRRIKEIADSRDLEMSDIGRLALNEFVEKWEADRVRETEDGYGGDTIHMGKKPKKD